MCKIKNTKDKDKAIKTLTIWIYILIALNIAIFGFYYCHHKTIIVSDESIVLIFVGILATFVVVNNYSQIIIINKEINRLNENMNHNFIKKTDELINDFDILKEKITNLQKTEDFKKEYNITNILKDEILKLKKCSAVNFDAIKLLLNLLNFSDDKPQTYFLNNWVYMLSSRFFSSEKISNSKEIMLEMLNKYNQISIELVNYKDKDKDLMFHYNLHFTNRLYYLANKNDIPLNFNFYKNFKLEYDEIMTNDYKEVFKFHETKYNEKVSYLVIDFPNDKIKNKNEEMKEKINDYIRKCEE